MAPSTTARFWAGCPGRRPIWWPGADGRDTWRMGHALGRRRPCLCALLLAVPLVVFVASACGSLPPISNPSTAGATPTPTTAPPVRATPAPVPEAIPEPFEPFWVQNHRITELWSGASGGPDTVSF